MYQQIYSVNKNESKKKKENNEIDRHLIVMEQVTCKCCDSNIGWSPQVKPNALSTARDCFYVNSGESEHKYDLLTEYLRSGGTHTGFPVWYCNTQEHTDKGPVYMCAHYKQQAQVYPRARFNFCLWLSMYWPGMEQTGDSCPEIEKSNISG